MPQGSKAAIEEADLKAPYVAAVCRFADMDLIGKTKFKFAIDSMYGSGREFLPGSFRSVAFRSLQSGRKSILFFRVSIPSRSSRTSLCCRKLL